MNNDINNASINRFGGYCINGKSYSAIKIAECIDVYHLFTLENRKEPTVSEFMLITKIGKCKLTIKIIYKIKYGLDLSIKNQGPSHNGLLSILNSNELI